MITKKTHIGSGTATIYDMTFAGKRGKECRVLSFRGWMPSYHNDNPTHKQIYSFTYGMLINIGKLAECNDYDRIAKVIGAAVEKFKTECPDAGSMICCDERTIKAIEAPKPLLTVNVPGKFSGHADEDGVTLDDQTDNMNLPAMCTHRQSHAEAYRLAAKVWDKVKQADSFHQAGNILSDAGCRLHYWCRMD